MAEDETSLPVAGSFEEARRRQLTAGLSATPVQRLDWLEEMIELAKAGRRAAAEREAERAAQPDREA